MLKYENEDFKCFPPTTKNVLKGFKNLLLNPGGVKSTLDLIPGN
jgi:hypothetical protein